MLMICLDNSKMKNTFEVLFLMMILPLSLFEVESSDWIAKK